MARSRHGRGDGVGARLVLAVLLALSFVLSTGAGLPAPTALAAGPCDAPVNPIVAENCLTGNPSSEWDVSGAGDANLQGFATDISVNRGNTVSFKIKSNASNYRLDIYRMGYYGGQGARKVATVTPSVALPQSQPNCLSNGATGLLDCGNWAVSASWAVPANAASGIYFARLVRIGASGSSHIFFVVRDDASTSAMFFQTSDTTWQAYNTYGGNSFYVGSPAGRAYKLSYNRPFNTRSVDNGQDWVFNAEYPMVRWLERNGYDVSYTTGVDSDRRGNLIRNHRLFLSVGHDEYWSAGQRANVEAARDAGVHLAFFSGNEVFWKTRWETSIDGSGTPYRTLVTYKETHANAKIDPNPAWTGTWRDPRFSPPADGGRPENALTGTIFTVNCCTYAMQVPAAEGKLRFWRNTSVATLGAGQTATLPNGTLGYEWDEDLDNGFRPGGLLNLSKTTVSGVDYIQDYGSTYSSGTATHALTLYRHPSGALVFGAGTVQWSWGLDNNHDRGSTAADSRMQQATLNLFADMGVQPATLQAGLVAATASTDTTAPTSTITSPAPGATVQAGNSVVITGTATDAGGGILGVVEVSVDGGTTWRRATGLANWSYAWTPSGLGSVTIKSRAVDDSVNVQTPSAGVTVTIGPRTCPCSIWGSATTPQVLEENDNQAIEVGVKFRADVAGSITGVRYYKGPGNTGTHLGRLWSSTGTQLATATFSGETASGWQQVSFATPVAITANTTYIASYYAPIGRYSRSSDYFTAGEIVNAPLRALADSAGGNGVYRYGSGGGFPNQTYQSENYWVDVVFVTSTGPDTTPPTVTGQTPASGATGVAVGSNVTATFSEPMDAATIGTTTVELRNPSNALVTAVVTYDAASRTATLDPAADLAASTTYTATVKGGATDPRVKDAAGNALAANASWSFTTVAADTTPPTVTARTPAAGATGVGTGTTVTATFSEAMDATTISTTTVELRQGGTGGTLVPASVAYNATTRVATLTPGGALATGASYTAIVKGGGAGVKDAAGNALATDDAWSFTTVAADTTPPTVTATTPANGATGIAVGSTVTASFSEAMDAATIGAATVELRDAASALVASTVSYNATTRVATLTPGAALTANSTYTATVKGGATDPRVKDAAGNALAANASWSFTTATGPTCPCSIWSPSATPQVLAENDNQAIEIGVKFRADVAGSITGVRYYKSTTNTGTHLGRLWSSSGTQLATATFTGETASGWQQVSFATPVAIAANTTYVASYYAPVGRYSRSSNYFTAGEIVNAPLRALADSAGGNGVYRYGSGGGFPNQTYQSENYWVDVVFVTSTGPDTTPPTVTGRTPASGATGVGLGTAVTATFSEGMTASTINTTTVELRNPSNALVTAVVTYDAASRTATLTPTSTLAASTTYTATVKGGATDPRVKDAAGNALATNQTWSFTTVAADTTPPTVTARTPAAGATGVGTGTTVTATFSEAMTAATINGSTIELRTAPPANALVTATVSYNATTRVATLTPSVALIAGTPYTATVKGGSAGVKDAAGNALAADDAWSFTTATGPSCPCSIWAPSATPQVMEENDNQAVEVGVKFQSDVAGFITGIRYHKGPGNTGTHVGHLWSSSGQLLATATFTGETASGWQQVSFATPVAIAANTTYVASYYAPIGRYSRSSNYFAGGEIVNAPLRALQDGPSGGNGVYRYGSGGGFPDQTYESENYWVDVVFTTS